MAFEIWMIWAAIVTMIFVLSIVFSVIIVLAPDKIFGVNKKD